MSETGQRACRMTCASSDARPWLSMAMTLATIAATRIKPSRTQSPGVGLASADRTRACIGGRLAPVLDQLADALEVSGEVHLAPAMALDVAGHDVGALGDLADGAQVPPFQPLGRMHDVVEIVGEQLRPLAAEQQHAD